MTKDEFVEEVSKLPGVGRKKAEALYEAGYETVEKLRSASAEDLQKVPGVGPKIAQAIVEGLAQETKAATAPTEDKIEVREVKKTKGKDAKAKKKAEAEAEEEKPEVVEPEAIHRPKIKAELSEEVQKALALRAERYAHQPVFRKYHWWYGVGIPIAWRAPKGTLSKQRRGFKYRPIRVKIGFGKPALARGLHPSGFEEVLVANPAELALVVDPKTQAARIQGSVGTRKRKLIEAAAAEKNIRVLNPRRS